MNPFGWLVLVVFALIWILNNFLRGSEEERTANRRRNEGRQPEGQGPRRQKTEIEQFLEEVNRRRRQKTEGPQAPPREEQSVPMPTPMATRGTRPPGSARPDARRTRPVTRPTRSIPERQQEDPVLAEAVVLAESPPRPSVGQGALGQLTANAGMPAAAPLPAQAAEAKSVSLASLTALLKSTEGIRTAFVLQEVLGPPRCHRPR